MVIGERTTAFRALHQSGCFVMPNAWDAGSAVLLESLGFSAVASTSSGLAWSLGTRDNNVPLDAVLAHLRALVGAVGIPVNADFEGGFATEPEEVAENVRAGAETGIAGLSIEDSTGDPRNPLFDLPLAIERIRAAREAIDATGTGVLLTGRSEGFIVGRPDLAETVRRLRAYADAGAERLYAPGLTAEADIVAVVEAVAPHPVNVLVGSDFTTVSDLERLGVRRISVGGALARAAWTGAIAAAEEIARDGAFGRLAESVSGGRLEALFPDAP